MIVRVDMFVDVNPDAWRHNLNEGKEYPNSLVFRRDVKSYVEAVVLDHLEDIRVLKNPRQ
ncbi:MAG TPA: hypothetical protein PK852_02580 [Mesotoga prima]|uniref:hypothetical protein n=1 Tax=Mesotoga prima TaxID=1184387 RepID=UPI002CAFDBA1|nr:hypothetical protein [Mesotoga prima]HPE52981.1 hypothetical protein [Mesotoga prima]